LPNHCR